MLTGINRRLTVGFVVVGVFASMGMAQSQPTSTAPTAKKTVVMKLDGAVREVPLQVDLAVFGVKANLFWDQLRLIRTAGNDETVGALVLLIDQPELNVAQAQELRRELDRFRATGRRVYVHADSLTTTGYVAALGGGTIAMTPGAELDVTGVSVGTLFFKGLLDKIGVEMQVEHVGAFKLAGEPFVADKPSPEMTEQLTQLADDLYEQLTTAVSQSRGLSIDAVKSAIDRGPYVAVEAVNAKLVDRECSRDEFVKFVRDVEPGELVKKYQIEAPKLTVSGFAGFMQMLGSMSATTPKDSRAKVAIVNVSGAIVEGDPASLFDEESQAGATRYRKALEKMAKDRTIKAVVIRIDSPGGSATASEIIYRLLADYGKNVPVVVSMGGTAASGGYYIACAGRHVFASPGTISASIGVVAAKPVLTGLAEKVGVNHFAVSRGRNARMSSMMTPWGDDQRVDLRRQLDAIYSQFVDRVAVARNKKVADVKTLATGRVYTGRQCKELGLVDEMGTLADAVDYAAKQAKLTSYQVTFQPEPKDFMQFLMESLGVEMDEANAGSVRWALAATATMIPRSPATTELRVMMNSVKWLTTMASANHVIALSPVVVEMR